MQENRHGNYTKIPNWILDNSELELDPYEFAILMHILRRTIGFGKKSDGIAFSQFAEATKMSRSSVIRTIEKLRKKRVIQVKKQRAKDGGDSFNRYSLHPRLEEAHPQCQTDTPQCQPDTHKIRIQQTVYDTRTRGNDPDPAREAVTYALEHFDGFVAFLVRERAKGPMLKPNEEVEEIENIDRYKNSVLQGLKRRDDLTVKNAFIFYEEETGMEEQEFISEQLSNVRRTMEKIRRRKK